MNPIKVIIRLSPRQVTLYYLYPPLEYCSLTLLLSNHIYTDIFLFISDIILTPALWRVSGVAEKDRGSQSSLRSHVRANDDYQYESVHVHAIVRLVLKRHNILLNVYLFLARSRMSYVKECTSNRSKIRND